MADAGRPTDYKEEYCEKVLEYAAQGFFLDEIAEKFSVDGATMWRWTKVHPRFCNSYTRAKHIIVSGLMRKLVENAHDRNYNVRAIEFVINMITRQMQHTTVQIDGINNNDMDKRLEAVLKALEDGKLRTDEFKNLVDGLKSAAELQYGMEAVKKLEKIEEKN